MHEASLVMSIMDTVISLCRQKGYRVIDSIQVNIGMAAGVLPDAMQFAFAIIKADTIARDAELIINHIPLGGSCRQCGKSFESPERYIFNCPSCHATDLEVTRGYEMEIVDMEVD